jgi:drug/metabolite transporter (DMT)-like permease
MTASKSRLVALAFVAETLFAGANGVAIRFSNRELAPIWGAGLRFALAGILIVGVMLVLKLALPRGRSLLGAMLFGLLQFAGAFGFAYLALVRIHAGVGQTLLALVPLATLLLAVTQRQERLSGAAVAGTLLGLAGIGLIFLDPGREAIPPIALLLVLASVLCFAQALVLVRRLPPVHPVALNAVGMVTGALVLLIASVLLGESWLLPKRADTWGALVYLVVIGSIVVFLLHVFVAQKWTASRASYVMVTIPLVTIVLSAWLDQEPVTPGLLLGGLLVMVGVYVGALRTERTSRRSPAGTRAAASDQ